MLRRARDFGLVGLVLVCSAASRADARVGDGTPPDPIPFEEVPFSRGTLLVDAGLREYDPAFAAQFDRFDAVLRDRGAVLAALRADGPSLIAQVNTIIGREPDAALATWQRGSVGG